MSKREIIQNEGSFSHYIRITKEDGSTIHIPVIDARDGMVERALGEQMIKASNRSRYMNYNHYHISHRKPLNPISNDSQL
jgi:hypothetical protein